MERSDWGHGGSILDKPRNIYCLETGPVLGNDLATAEEDQDGLGERALLVRRRPA